MATDTTSTDRGSAHEQINQRIKSVAGGDWVHRIELDEAREYVPAENLKYRLSILRLVFDSLFKNQSVLVLNEGSGLYPVMIRRSGAARVTANNMSRDRCDVMSELSSFSGQPFEILNQNLVLFDESQVFVDLDYAESHNFLFAQNLIWPLYNAAGQSFADVVEACAHYVTDGLVFDWTNAEWARPAPPEGYNRDNFHAALRERFEYVFACTDWLTLALGKLPVEGAEDESSYLQAANPAYKQLTARIRGFAQAVLPQDATVMVVSKGDPALVNLIGQVAWHFPQSEDGHYTGSYPVHSAQAIEHLETLRAKGGTHLLLPVTASWWLDYYQEFAQHLEQNYRKLMSPDESCMIFDLGGVESHS